MSVAGPSLKVKVMRIISVILTAGIGLAQSSSTTYQKNVNGNREAVYSEDRGKASGSTERGRSVDGHQVPLEQASERVVREGANGKVVERTIKRYDPNGRVSSTDRILVEETKLPNGGKLVKETLSRSDINGGFKEFERRTTETRVVGQTSESNVTIDRPNVNGGFATAERRSIVTTGPANQQISIETVEQPTGNGGFRPVRRSEAKVVASGSRSTQDVSNYELDATGRMTLTAQKTEITTKRTDGSEVVETTLFSKNVAGEVQGPDGRMRVKEQQVLEREVGADGQVRETLSVRRPSMADPEKLGALQKVSEKICTGKCLPDTVTKVQSSKEN